MTRLVVSGEVRAAFSGLRITAVVASGFDGHSPWPELDARFADLQARAGDLPADGVGDDPHLAAWQAAYRAFGTNPRRQRPSAEALRRRLARSGQLPRINPAVDCYNLVSASFGVPAGAFDLGQVCGDIMIRFADGSEVFTPLGEPGSTENPRPGEVDLHRRRRGADQALEPPRRRAHQGHRREQADRVPAGDRGRRRVRRTTG